MVDEVIRVQEIVVRPLGSQLISVRRIDGGAVTLGGDGHLVLVLDPLELIQDAMQAERPVPAPVLPQATQQRILVVDDSVTSRALLQAILEGAGYQVETAVNGLDAFARLKQHEFDMVVSDVDMPRMNGFTLTEKIRAEGGQVAGSGWCSSLRSVHLKTGSGGERRSGGRMDISSRRTSRRKSFSR